MKYSVIVLACVLAVAVADFNNGQYVPDKQYNNYNKFNQYKPSSAQKYQNNPYKPYLSSTPYPSRFVSSTPFPSRFVSSTPVPVTIAPARSTILPVAPARSVFNTPSVVAVKPVSALPARSWSSPKAALPIPSAVPARSVFSTVPATSFQAELPAQSAAQAATLEISAAPAKSALPTPSASPSLWAVPAAPVVPVAPVAPVSRVAQVVSVVPVVPAAKTVLPIARYAGEAHVADTVRYNNQINADGAFEYSYETNNGIVAQEHGSPRSFYSGEDAVAPVVAEGSFGWTSPEGQQISISYFADETGYHPTGSAIPQAPEIPPQIARALAYIASRSLPASN